MDFSLQGAKGITKAYWLPDRKDSNPLSTLFYSFVGRIEQATRKVRFGYGQDQGRAVGHPGQCPPRPFRERPTHVLNMETLWVSAKYAHAFAKLHGV